MFAGIIDWQPDNRRYARTLANLDIGEPRTVRLIYFLPNDRDFRPEVVQRMKDEIRRIQAFFAEQMGAHGYGEKTFNVETDAQGEPLVHRVNGQLHSGHYLTALTMLDEIRQAFDFDANIYVIVVDKERNRIGDALGVGSAHGKNGGVVLVPSGFTWDVVAHELGHAFGLQHDFRNDANIMSFSRQEGELSAYSANFLAVHTFLNPDVSLEETTLPTIELISSSEYAIGSRSVSIQFKLSDPDGLHQVLLFVTSVDARGLSGLELKACRDLEGKQNAVIEFDYDGVIPSDSFTSLSHPEVHPIYAWVVDANGNIGRFYFSLRQYSPGHVVTLEAHPSVVLFLSFSFDGSTRAVGANDNTVKLWDVEMGTSTGALQRGSSVAFSPDGTSIATGSTGARLSCGMRQLGKMSPRFQGIRIGPDPWRFRPTGGFSLPVLLILQSNCGMLRRDKISQRSRDIGVGSILWRFRPMG